MIALNKNWDLSATIKQMTVNNEKFQTKIPGRFDPEIATGEDIQTLCTILIGAFTTNTYIETLMTAQRNLTEIIEDEN